MISLFALLFSFNCFAASPLSFLISFDKNIGIKVDPAVQPYYDDFMKSAQAHGVYLKMNKLTIRLVKDSEFTKADSTGFLLQDNQREAFGSCHYEQHEILISRNVWKKFSDIDRQAIVDHEMGHCYLGRKHDDSLKNNGISLYFSSIMFSSSEVKGFYERHQAYYRTELFDSTKFFQIGKESE
jgi:hypothetical protein